MLRTLDLPGLTMTNQFSREKAYLAEIRNWDNASETKRNSEQRETGFGLYRDDDPEEGGRFPIVYGRLSALPDGDVHELRARVMALKNLDSFEMRVGDPTGEWRAEVQISGQIQFDIKDDGWCDFEIPLEAADPRKYGPKQTLTTGIPTPGVGVADPLLDPVQEGEPGNLARVVCVNAGTAPSEPIVTIYGGMSEGFETLCIEHGHVIRVTRPIPDGSYVTVNHSSGEVWIDGQSLLPSTYLSVSEWYQVGPAETCTIQWAPLGTVSGTPRMVVEFSEASW